MKKIYKLAIKNFKAFQDEEIFEFKGKNVLVYGSNGSGKSSLFWALYTFLQSSIKSSDEEIEKYFDSNNSQSLLNIFLDENTSAKIEMTYIDEDTQETHTNIISKETINTRENQTIQELNLASDFINYKLLHNFYNASHKDEVNLWSVFERDIFPFLTDDILVVPWLEKIINITNEVPMTPTGYLATGKRKNIFKDRLEKLNTEIENLLSEVEKNANILLKKHFFEGKDVLKISLSFKKKFTYDNVKTKLWEDGYDAVRHSKLQIKLMVEIYNEEIKEWKEIHRVQSFLNEAQLTRIAIAIRIGALRARVQGTDFKILVLDDMLNSLDMSNRVDVMRIILNKENNQELQYFDTYQKIILTHDKGFFNLLKRHTDDEEWVYYKFTKDETKNEAPKVKKDLTHMQKAQKYFDEDEFDAGGNELRKEAENIFTNFLDPEMKNVKDEFETLSKKIEKVYHNLLHAKHQKFKKIFSNNHLDIEKIRKIDTDVDNDDSLSGQEKTAIKALRQNLHEFLYELTQNRDTKEKHIEHTKEILNRVLNSASHHSDNPLHRQELKNAINHMIVLKELLENETN